MIVQTDGPEETDNPAARPGVESKGEVSDRPAEEEEVGETEAELPLNVIFEMLRNERRRRVLRYLWEHEGAGTLGELAEHIAAIENETTRQALTAQQRKRVYVGLYQCHLPKLDDADVVNFDQDRGTVELHPNAEQLRPYIASDDEGSTAPYYPIVTVAGVVAYVALMFVLPTWALHLVVVGLIGGIGGLAYFDVQS